MNFSYPRHQVFSDLVEEGVVGVMLHAEHTETQHRVVGVEQGVTSYRWVEEEVFS